MFTRDAIQHFGNAPKLAQALGLTKGAIYQWGDRVPPLRAARLHQITRGKLRFDPSDYPSSYWRHSLASPVPETAA
jgi:DNA-binding transcriptional regulator YdaS (Cro superfamily)